MSYGTLVIARGPTLADGLVSLLRQADALIEARDCGITVCIDGPEPVVVDAWPDPELPAGVIEYHQLRTPLTADPWQQLGHDYLATVAQVELSDIEAIHQLTSRDVVVTPAGARWL